jgi:phosphoserine aminotransferase
MTFAKPAKRPNRPHFSSGPCAKRPGWSLEALDAALVGRSHRSKPGKARLQEVIDRTRAILGVPADYRIGIVPASDTGAVEMALWSLLGARGVDMLAWESFGAGWVTDVVKQLKLCPTCRRSRPSATWCSPGTARPRACGSPTATGSSRTARA